MHKSILYAFSLPKDIGDKEILKYFKALTSSVCKPCWELNYCPYGPLVEQSPLLPPNLKDALNHNEYLKKCLITGKLDDGRELDSVLRGHFEESLESFNPSDYPVKIPKDVLQMQCIDFGHICPVFLYSELFSETKCLRKNTRYISRATMFRVARRDNNTCQICGKHLLDSDIEFDHIIPFSRGGSSEESNIRVTCGKCNKTKSNKTIPGLRKNIYDENE